MSRAALRFPLRHAAVSQRRSFVSTVLLTKAWENETVVELRKEARKRGLPSSGNKATLITRLQSDDQKKVLAPEPVPAASQVRYASTVPAVETATEVPGIPSMAEPVFARFTLDVTIPDANQPIPEPPVQIPLTPDRWDSSTIKKAFAPAEVVPSTEPKVLVVGGEATHPAASPNLHISDSAESPSASDSVPRKEPTSQLKRLVADMADDLGLPTSYELPKFTTDGGESSHGRSRPLNADEKRGAQGLLATFVGGFVGSYLFNWWNSDAPVPASTEGKDAHAESH